MSTAVPLSDLAAMLARELAESAAAAESRQRETDVALAEEFSGTAEAYAESVVGPAEVSRYVDEVVMPLLPKQRELDETARARLAERLGSAIPSASIERKALEEMALIKLRRDAIARHRDARALLANGLPKVQIRGCKLDVKLFLDKDQAGGVVARLANDTTVPASPHDTVSTLTLELDMGEFPAI
jgi:hypothetical protein